MSAHAKLSPSAAERWINCPPSVRLSEGFEDTPSVYAAEGTLAHRLAELKLRRELAGEYVDEAEFTALRSDPLYDTEMEDHTDEYLERVRSVMAELENPALFIETRLELEELVGGPCFGTADCVVCAPGKVEVLDFKYGRNVVVKAPGNPQTRLYALGAAALFDVVYGVESVTTTIVQPRAGNVSSETLTLEELRTWASDVVRPAARAAVDGAGTPRRGDWCRFCPAKAVCRTYGEAYASPPDRRPPDRLTPAEIGQRVAELEGVDTYLKELKDAALSIILGGGEIPGYKAVEGRSNRVWTDQEAAFQAAEAAGYDRALLFERRPLSLSKVERLMGKRTFSEVLGEYVDKPQGKPTLVKSSDKRPAYTRADAREDFKDIEI